MDLDPNIVVNHEDLAEIGPLLEHDPNSQQIGINQGSGSQKIDMWRNRNFDSGFQTMNHSEAPSIISSLHPSSHISGVSSVADFDQIPSLSDQQKQKFDSISCGTNESQYGSAVRAIPELTNLMKDQDHAVVHKAVYIMQNIAKMDGDPMRRQEETVIKDIRVVFALRDILREKLEHPNIIRVALGTLFNICNRTEGLDLISNAINAQPDLIQCLVNHIGTFQFSCYKYAILTLHSIISDKHRGSQALILARRCEALKPACHWLDAEKSEKLLPVIVDLVRILCDKQNDQKEMFIKLGGSMKLLHIIRVCNYENLLWRSTQLLKTFSNFNAADLVYCGAREILCRLLTHQSQRLIISALETLRNTSDVPSQYKEENLLKSLVMLIGTGHPTVMLYVVQILSNLVANNKFNKEFLVCNNGADLLLRALHEASSYLPRLGADDAHLMEEYMESIVCVLRQLCVGHSFADRVQALVFKQPLVFLEKLLLMRPLLLKQTLSLLLKLAPNNGLLCRFRDTRSGRTTFVEQIIYIWKVSCNQLSTGEVIEGVRVKELIHHCVEILRLLSRHHDLVDQIVFFLRTPENNRLVDSQTFLPIFVLQKNNIDENTKKSALFLLHNLMLNDQMSTLLENNQVFINLLQQFKVSQVSSELANIADNILKMMIEKKERNMFSRFTGTVDNRFPTPASMESTTTNEMMELSGAGEAMDGAGEQWSQPSILDDYYGDMYSESVMSREPSKPYNSPTYNSPTPVNQEFPPATGLPPFYPNQPSTSAYRHTTRPAPSPFPLDYGSPPPSYPPYGPSSVSYPPPRPPKY